MRRFRLYCQLLVLLWWSISLSSCIRDDIQPCPPLKVRIDIQDKNYSNIDFVESHTGLEHRIDENLSFRNYIQKLFYVLYNLNTGEVVTVQHLHEVTGDAMQATVYLPDELPFGQYRLVVWGNINSEEGIFADGHLDTYDLHHGGIEGYDVYMTADELVYDEWHYEYTVKLKRLKGKLVILAENFPEEISGSKKRVSGVMGNVDHDLHYSESEDVVTYRVWGRSSSYVSSTILSPSVSASGSDIDALLYDRPEMTDPALQLDKVTAVIRRNEITVLRYDYHPDTGTVDIYILMDDGWNEVINLEK